MDKVQIMRLFPNDIPPRMLEYAEKTATTGRSFASWVEVIDDDIMQRIFGYRRSAKKGLLITEVVRRITGETRFLVKNLYYTRMGGYIPVYDAKPKYQYWQGYRFEKFPSEDFDVWFEWGDGCHISSEIINVDEALASSERFKYCGYPGGCGLMQYLNEYIKNPRIELFGKIGIAPSKTLVRKAEQDRQFCRFIRDNAFEVNTMGPQATIYAYDHHMTISSARRYLHELQTIGKDIKRKCTELNATITPLKVRDYLRTQVDKDKEALNLVCSYNDYLKAIKYLGYDMKDTKNIFPKDFKRMHDLRIAEYDSKKAKEDKGKRKKLYDDFRRAGENAKALEWSDGKYTVVIPTDCYDLVREGRALNHCVGKQGYDVKVAKGEVLIAFVRKVSRPNVPFVTVEYGFGKTPAGDRLYQQHGKDNHVPDTETCKFIDAWVKRAKKIRKELVNVEF